MERKFIETELGRIPSDWIVTTIKDAGTAITDGINPQKYRESEFCEYSMPAYDCGMSPNICKGSSMNSNRTKISGEVLLFNKLNVRQRRVWYVENAPANSVCSMEFLAYKSNVICLPLLREILLQDKVTNDFISVSRGTSNSQKRIAPSDFWNYKVAVPADIKEQQRIASCLSSINEMISKLTESIEKKQLIKEGLMQELLTGKKRLARFNGEWKQITLGEYCSIVMGQSPSSTFYNQNGVGLPLIQGNSDFENRKSIIRTYTSYITKTCNQNDTIMSVRAPVGAVGKASSDSCLGRGVCAFRTDTDFLFYYMQYNEDKWGQFSKGSTFDSINRDDLCSVIISVPPSKKEESAICDILSSFDKDIEQAISQRDKYLLIKQGMMQQLLTGKTRL